MTTDPEAAHSKLIVRFPERIMHTGVCREPLQDYAGGLPVTQGEGLTPASSVDLAALLRQPAR